jgi:nitronate monooxygenase
VLVGREFGRRFEVVSSVLERLARPVVLAPMAGGPGTPELAAAVTEAGGLGFLAAGYLTPERVAADLAAARRLTDGPLGVNVFSPPAPLAPGAAEAVAAYGEVLAARHGTDLLGEPRHDDDGLAAKIDVLLRQPPEVVSFTFGPPSPAVVEALHDAGAEVWSTVTDRAEAIEAAGRGVDVLIAQGAEAGGHQGSTVDDDRPPLAVLDLLAAVAVGEVGVPVVAAGGIVDAADTAAARAAGAAAVQVGTAVLVDPVAPVDIARGIAGYLRAKGLGSTADLRGRLRVPAGSEEASR